ncbi:Sec-independent protein translocase subunit TatA [Actinotalea subterranea]|uniref:Sec-independent protein translocase subunit TatA n=1 Tax=Actinotalea subterranea TaxID=2607497 RepID=UPI0011EFD929|nr:Sec-independent protein translocase subunit TatA [Actinotalea subterranea]
MLRNLQGWEWIILLLIVLLLFGARRLPDLARSVGRSMKIFKSEVKDIRGDPPRTSGDDSLPAEGPTVPGEAAPQATAPTADDDGGRPRP